MIKISIALTVVGIVALSNAAPQTIVNQPGFPFNQNLGLHPFQLNQQSLFDQIQSNIVNNKPIDTKTAPIESPKPIAIAEPVDVFAPASYSYAYRVDDEEEDDHKEHSETREGDSVKGKYSVVEPDGTLRIVTYTADAINGFQAVVERKPNHIVVKPRKVKIAPVLVATPAPAPAPTQAPLHIISTHSGPVSSPIQLQLPTFGTRITNSPFQPLAPQSIPIPQPIQTLPRQSIPVPVQPLTQHSVQIPTQIRAIPSQAGHPAATFTLTSPFANFNYIH